MTNVTTTSTTLNALCMSIGALFALVGEAGREYIRLGFGIGRSLGCLDFLNGRNGTIKGNKTPEWVEELETSCQARIEWNEGYITIDGKRRKFGKWLRQQIKKGMRYQACLKEFETRSSLCYEWEISTKPSDVLGMSYNRAWTSCMRPGGAFEDGAVTDYTAGAAVVLYYRPGADQPCGREVLRPGAIETKEGLVPLILRGGTIYGNGIKIPNRYLVEKGSVTVCHCRGIGDYGLIGLRNKVYCDVERTGCEQTEKEATEAKIKLRMAFNSVLEHENAPEEREMINSRLYDEEEEEEKIRKEQSSSAPVNGCGRRLDGRHGGCPVSKALHRAARETLYKKLIEEFGTRTVHKALQGGVVNKTRSMYLIWYVYSEGYERHAMSHYEVDYTG